LFIVFYFVDGFELVELVALVELGFVGLDFVGLALGFDLRGYFVAYQQHIVDFVDFELVDEVVVVFELQLVDLRQLVGLLGFCFVAF
jgi:hypothetical protein